MLELRNIPGNPKGSQHRIVCCIVTRSGREDYLRRTLKAIRREGIPTLLWANGAVAEDVKQGHEWVHEHAFNVGQHVAHNEMLDECVRLGAEYHLRMDDDCWINTQQWAKRMLANFDEAGRYRWGRVSLGINIHGLKHPPVASQRYEVKHDVLEHVDIIGGIFRMTPMSIMRYFRWDERLPMGAGEARQFANFCSSNGISMLRSTKVQATHGDSTQKQEDADGDWAYEHDMLQFMPLGL